VSPLPCLRRLWRLKGLGVIHHCVAQVDPQEIGLDLLAYVTVKLEKHGKMPMEDFRARVQTWPEVVACYAMTGDMDYLLRVHVEDMEHFSRLVMSRLLTRPGVVDVKSGLALDVSKRPPRCRCSA
jgi:Lrp/AsnC family transcriptional regulator, leucine-responsive regulatory protein